MLAMMRPAVVLLLVMTGLTGIAYPLLVTGMAQLILPARANGSAVVQDGRLVGSALIGQLFTSEHYFSGRPSAAGDAGYDAAASSGSNLGPLSKKLMERVGKDVAALNASGIAEIPADAVTTSASGLDPHISPAYAAAQVARVARARQVPAARVREIVERTTEMPLLGLIGEPRVNVLMLNLALDSAFGKPNG